MRGTPKKIRSWLKWIFAGFIMIAVFLGLRSAMNGAVYGEDEFQFRHFVSEAYLPYYFEQHRTWPTDLTGSGQFLLSPAACKYWGCEDGRVPMAQRWVKLLSETRPEISGRQDSNGDFEGIIVYHLPWAENEREEIYAARPDTLGIR